MALLSCEAGLSKGKGSRGGRSGETHEVFNPGSVFLWRETGESTQMSYSVERRGKEAFRRVGLEPGKMGECQRLWGRRTHSMRPGMGARKPREWEVLSI